MEKEKLDEYLAGQDFDETAEKIIRRVFAESPVRNTQGNRRNVRSRFPSTKNLRTRQIESHAERAYALIIEHEPEVFGYVTQTPRIPISESDGSSTYGFNTIPDFFELRTDWAGWTEVKIEQNLENEREDYPDRYVQDEHGEWSFPAAESFAQERGLEFNLVLGDNLNENLVQNLLLLRSY